VLNDCVLHKVEPYYATHDISRLETLAPLVWIYYVF